MNAHRISFIVTLMIFPALSGYVFTKHGFRGVMYVWGAQMVFQFALLLLLKGAKWLTTKSTRT